MTASAQAAKGAVAPQLLARRGAPAQPSGDERRAGGWHLSGGEHFVPLPSCKGCANSAAPKSHHCLRCDKAGLAQTRGAHSVAVSVSSFLESGTRGIKLTTALSSP